MTIPSPIAASIRLAAVRSFSGLGTLWPNSVAIQYCSSAMISESSPRSVPSVSVSRMVSLPESSRSLARTFSRTSSGTREVSSATAPESGSGSSRGPCASNQV